MASYGGYSKTSYGGQGAEDGGGFMGGSQQGSQGGQGGGKSSYQDESLRPVTIKQLLDVEEPYPDAGFVLDGQTITQVTLVGQVRSVQPQATNVTYRLDDGTGVIDVKKWIDPEKKDEGGSGGGNYPLDSFVRVWGRLKAFSGRKHVGAHFLRAVDDYNEVNYHMLEAAYVHLYFTKGGPAGAGAGADDNAGSGGGGGDGMFVDSYGGGGGGGGGKAANCSGNAQRVFSFLGNTPGGGEGMEANQIARGTSLSVRDVEAAADELLAQGLIYTTVDDHTWAILDY